MAQRAEVVAIDLSLRGAVLAAAADPVLKVDHRPTRCNGREEGIVALLTRCGPISVVAPALGALKHTAGLVLWRVCAEDVERERLINKNNQN